MIIFPVKYLTFFYFCFEKKVDGKLFSGIHLVSALLAAFVCLANNILSLYPQAIAILICCLLQYMFNVGGKEIVIPGIYFLNNVCITYVLTSPAFADHALISRNKVLSENKQANKQINK